MGTLIIVVIILYCLSLFGHGLADALEDNPVIGLILLFAVICFLCS